MVAAFQQAQAFEAHFCREAWIRLCLLSCFVCDGIDVIWFDSSCEDALSVILSRLRAGFKEAVGGNGRWFVHLLWVVQEMQFRMRYRTVENVSARYRMMVLRTHEYTWRFCDGYRRGV